ncbi:MAG TPA: RidA family protein, partial [Lachnoclostridium sp.]|nr:RidA family protein [Lachnoclostridium sp.]
MKDANPIPQGKYVPANRFGQFIFTAGMTPRNN